MSKFNTIFISLLLTLGLKGYAQTVEPTAIVPISGGSSYLIEPINVTATSGGTMYLTNLSKTNQVLTGTSANNVVLPNATTIKRGRYFNISNRSTQAITVQYNDLSTAKSLAADSQAKFMVRVISTANGTWDITNTVASIDLENPSQISGVLQTANGGVGYSSYANGDLLYGYNSSLVKLALGTNGYVLTVSGGLPSWQSGSGGGSSLPSFVSGQVLSNDGTNPYWVSGTSWFVNPQLSNLGSTAVNADILPDGLGNRNLGSSDGGLRWQNIWGNFVSIAPTGSFGLRDPISTSPIMTLAPTTAPDGTASSLMWRGTVTSIASYPAIGMSTRDQSPQRILVQTGNGNGATNSAAIHIRTGLAAGFSRGEINLEAAQVTLNNVKLVSMAEPTNVSDAATKNYVDVKVISLPSNVTGVLGATNGGTGQSTFVTGDILYAPGTASMARLPIGTSGTFLVANGSGVPEYIPMLISGAALNQTTVSGAYSALASDVTILAYASSASFTITIPSAASVPAYHRYLIKKSDYNNSTPKIVSIDGAYTDTLITPDEAIEIESDGVSTWALLRRHTDYDFGCEPIDITAVTTSPVKGTNSADKMCCVRKGSNLNCFMNYVSTGNGTAGSGNYLIGLPNAVSGIATINTSITNTTTSATVVTALTTAAEIGVVNFSNNATLYEGSAVPYNINRFRIVAGQGNTFWTSGTVGFSGTVQVGGFLTIPITNWKESK